MTEPTKTSLLAWIAHKVGLNPGWTNDQEWRVSRGFLHPGPRAQWALLLLALALGYLVYTASVSWVYRKTWSAYYTGNALSAALDQMPRLFEVRDPTYTSDGKRDRAILENRDQDAVLLLFLQNLGVLEKDLLLEQVKTQPSFALLRQILCKDNELRFYQKPTSDLVTSIILNLGSQKPLWYEGTPTEFQGDLRRILTAMLADYPGVYSAFIEFGKIEGSGDPESNKRRFARSWGSLCNKADRSFGSLLGLSGEGLQLQITSTTPTVEQMLHLLYQQAGLRGNPGFDSVKVVDPAPKSATAPANSGAKTNQSNAAQFQTLTLDEVERMEKFLSKLLSASQSLPQVKFANLWMAVIRGYEQFGLLIAFIWMLLLLWIRRRRRLYEQDWCDLVVDEHFRETLKGLQQAPPEQRLAYGNALLHTFSVEDLKSEHQLAVQVNNTTPCANVEGFVENPCSLYFLIYSRLSPRGKKMLSKWKTSKPLPKRLKRSLVRAVNTLLQDPQFSHQPCFNSARERVADLPRDVLQNNYGALNRLLLAATLPEHFPEPIFNPNEPQQSPDEKQMIGPGQTWQGKKPQSTQTPQQSILKLLLRIVVNQLGRQGQDQTDKSNLEDTVRHIRGNDMASRWTIVWLSRALPALGFLGTVHGICLALMGADSLVRATSPEAQAAAVNIVAGNLGIAFTTTLIALLMGLLTSWLNDRQAYDERMLMSGLERELGYLIDPIGLDQDAPARRPFRR
jgi:hypothetical protein